MVGYYPKTKKEALELLRDHTDMTIYAGGTDLMVQKKFSEHVMFLGQIEAIKSTGCDSSNLYLGAGCTFTELLYADIPQIMKQVFVQVASPAIRNRGTIGGNICNASPAGDSLPMWYALHAGLKLEHVNETGEEQERIVPIRDYISGIRKTDQRNGEMLTQIIIPEKYCGKDILYYHKKVGARRSEAISKLSFFGFCKSREGKIADVGMGFGAVGITVVTDSGVERKLKGLDKEGFLANKERLIKSYMERVKPIDDQRSNAAYRKKVSENLLTDFFEQIEETL